jgi:Icc-related predicted phosphoesterase
MGFKLVFISDTHGEHYSIENDIPYGDFLIHCGDFTSMGRPSRIKNFMEWFVSMPHKHKILVPGNHELTLCSDKRDVVVRKCFTESKSLKMNYFFRDFLTAKSILKSYRDRVHILMDSGIELEGINFYGSHYCGGEEAIMKNWAFYKTEPELKVLFEKIPRNTDILITHMPPYGVLDDKLGSKELLYAVNKVNPYIHAFGHIHRMGGNSFSTDKTVFINCAVMDDNYLIKHKPVVHSI